MAAPAGLPAAEFFTPLNIATLGVATGAINAVANTFRTFGLAEPKRAAFATAIVIAYLLVAMRPSREWYEWVLAFLNACLLFCSAMGLNEVAAAQNAPPPGPGAGNPRRFTFFDSWI